MQSFWICRRFFSKVSCFGRCSYLSLSNAISISFSFLDFQREFEFIQYLQSFLALNSDSSKLLLDFLLLMCMCRQRNVFTIEMKNGGKKYPGGRNQSSVNDVGIIISGQLPIRTHDFLYPTNWLDILKVIVYFSSFWVTLSIVLITGTNNVNAFSLGYLISSFFFCYIGTNFYMKPIRSIVNWWNMLILFNIFVIFTKSILNLRSIADGTFLSNDIVASVHHFLSEVSCILFLKLVFSEKFKIEIFAGKTANQ